MVGQEKPLQPEVSLTFDRDEVVYLPAREAHHGKPEPTTANAFSIPAHTDCRFTGGPAGFDGCGCPASAGSNLRATSFVHPRGAPAGSPPCPGPSSWRAI